MSDYISILENSLGKAFSIDNYCNFIVNFLNGTELKEISQPRSAEFFAEYSYYIQNYTFVAEYIDPQRKKVGVYAIKLKKGRDIEKARSKQRNFVAKLISDKNFDAALAAFYTDDDTKWRLSFVRMDYEFVKGKVSQSLTPAKRYSYLVGEGEPCHTAKESLLPIFADENFTPTIDSIEQAFSVEKVTKQFFEKYREKYIQFKEYLESIDSFNEEASRKGFTSEQYSKKFMGQLVFLYFLQKKGWLGVNALPNEINETEYKKAFFYNATTRSILPSIYIKIEENNYRINASVVNSLSQKDDETLAKAVHGNAWGTGSRTFVRDLFEIANKKNQNFFDEYLEPLFYEALNKKRDADNYYSRLHCRIPFLNGGLFEPLDNYDWENNAFSIPNEMFSNKDTKGAREADGLLDVFDRYNFTMNEDEPLEKEVAVDPEMLGKIFENLLDVTDRKSKGAFYTPREIVHYMCQESLANYLVNVVDVPYDDVHDFILYGEIMKDEDCSRERRTGFLDMLIPETIYSKLSRIDVALADVRVADPAVGSGAFPMGMLSEIVKLREVITEYMARDLDKRPEFIDWYKDKKIAAQLNACRWKLRNEQRNSYILKKETMRNSIYAVDIEPSAVDIAKLRLWLTLVVEQEIDPSDPNNDSPIALPNLDFNIMCGNSLIDEFEGINLGFDSILYGDGGQSNLWNANIDIELEKLFVLQRAFFYADNHDKKESLRQIISESKNKLLAIAFEGASDEIKTHFVVANSLHSTPFFLWKLNFAKVFKDKGGFDIIIGNPPYIGESGNKEIFRAVAETQFGERCYMGKMDFFYFFFHKGIDLGNNDAEITFITTNYYLTATGARKLRKDFKERTQIRRLINFGEYKIFESAKGQHNIITFLTKNKSKSIYADCCSSELTGNIDNGRLNAILNWNDENTKYSRLIQMDLYDGNSCFIRFGENSIENKIIEKMKSYTVVKDFFDVSQGVVSGCDYVSNRNNELLGNTYTDIVNNDGIFVFNLLNPRDKNSISVWNREELCFLKDFYKNSDIEKYISSEQATKYLLYIDKSVVNISNYPHIAEHLNKFYPILMNRREAAEGKIKYFQLQWPRIPHTFYGPKIVVPYRCKVNAFAYNDVEWFCRSDAYVLTNKNNGVNIKYALALLNSKLYYFWLFRQGKRKGEVLELMREPLELIPLPCIVENKQIELANMADEIILKKKAGQNTELLERTIDAIVYKIYDLTTEEIAIVEGK